MSEETAKQLIGELHALRISIDRLLVFLDKLKIPAWLKK